MSFLTNDESRKAKASLLEAIEGFKEVRSDLRTGSWSDNKAKRCTLEVAALNGMQNAAGKLFVAEALFQDVEVRASLPATASRIKELSK